MENLNLGFTLEHTFTYLNENSPVFFVNNLFKFSYTQSDIVNLNRYEIKFNPTAFSNDPPNYTDNWWFRSTVATGKTGNGSFNVNSAWIYIRCYFFTANNKFSMFAIKPEEMRYV